MFELEQVEKAMKFMAETDSQYATAKAGSVAGKERLKTVLAQCYLDASGANIKERESEALNSQIYKSALDEYEDSILTFETLKAQRLRAELVIELFRTLEASRRKGNIT